MLFTNSGIQEILKEKNTLQFFLNYSFWKVWLVTFVKMKSECCVLFFMLNINIYLQTY